MLLARVISVALLFVLCSALYFGMFIMSSICSWGLFVCVFVMVCSCCCCPQCLWFYGARRTRCSTRDRRDFCPRWTMKYKVHDLWLLGWALCIIVAWVIIGCFYISLLKFRGSWFLITQGVYRVSANTSFDQAKDQFAFSIPDNVRLNWTARHARPNSNERQCIIPLIFPNETKALFWLDCLSESDCTQTEPDELQLRCPARTNTSTHIQTTVSWRNVNRGQCGTTYYRVEVDYLVKEAATMNGLDMDHDSFILLENPEESLTAYIIVFVVVTIAIHALILGCLLSMCLLNSGDSFISTPYDDIDEGAPLAAGEIIGRNATIKQP